MVNHRNVVAERPFQWHSADRVPALELNQIHLWVVTPDMMQMMSDGPHYHNVLSDRERHRAKHIINPGKRCLYTAGRSGLRVLLGQYTESGSAGLEFGYGPRGRPELLDTSGYGDLKFNYAVSAGHAFYGFSRNKNLGVDMEIFPRAVNTHLFARRILTGQENKIWQSLPEQEYNNAMLCCWTRKEAYGKLLGVGIRYAMNQVTLFTDLYRDHWHTKVTGLFNGESSAVRYACGVQVGLPMAGAAALMYESDSAVTSSRSEQHGPALNALMPSDLFWQGWE